MPTICRQALESCDPDTRRKTSAKVSSAGSAGIILNELFEATVEASLTQPTFVLEHPVEISPLAKPHRSKPGVTERFELFVAGEQSDARDGWSPLTKWPLHGACQDVDGQALTLLCMAMTCLHLCWSSQPVVYAPVGQNPNDL